MLSVHLTFSFWLSSELYQHVIIHYRGKIFKSILKDTNQIWSRKTTRKNLKIWCTYLFSSFQKIFRIVICNWFKTIFVPFPNHLAGACSASNYLWMIWWIWFLVHCFDWTKHTINCLSLKKLTSKHECHYYQISILWLTLSKIIVCFWFLILY